MGQTAKLILPDKEIELPVIEGTEQERAVDVGKLRSETGYITLDPGYVNTGSCTSSITYIDGEKGILKYRGIPIEVLAEKSSFLEVSYLLINGRLPTQAELDSFEELIRQHSLLHESVRRFYEGFPRDAHPMGILASVVCALSGFYQDESTGDEQDTSYLNSIRILAKLPTITAWAYRTSIGRPFMYPDFTRSYSENFLYMMFGTPSAPYDVAPEVVEVLNLLMVLHADHEQNCSTSTVRMVRSSMSNMFACIGAGICALWGPRHGGANQHVIEMLEKIRSDGGDVKKFVERAKGGDKDSRLMGFGHRVYKNFDPRAKIIKEAADRALAKLNLSDELLDIAKELEEVALKDDYFVEKKLYPNVDFYSGIIYKALGIPVPAFPVMFALGRAPGWIANAKEYTEDPQNRIGRPRQIYTGETQRAYVPIDQRKAG